MSEPETEAFLGSDERTLLLLLAYIHVQHGAAEKAEPLYAALLALAPDDAEAAKGLAWARLEMDGAQAALTVLDTIAAPGEPGAVLHLLRARALARLGHVDDACVAMRSFRKLAGTAIPA
ncbi:MAG: hypothetical protein WDO68_04140 [Gammaproteobacteria bacterium]